LAVTIAKIDGLHRPWPICSYMILCVSVIEAADVIVMPSPKDSINRFSLFTYMYT